MAKISMRNIQKSTVEEYFNLYLSSAAAKGVKDKIFETYKHRFHSIAKRLNVTILVSGQIPEGVFISIIVVMGMGINNHSLHHLRKNRTAF